MRLSVQLFSLREAAKKNFPEVLETVAQMGYEAVEFAGLYGQAAADLRKVLDRLGLVTSSAHCALFDPTRWAQIEDDARALGHKNLVGGFRVDDFATEDSIRAAADKVNRAVEHFAPRGFSVGVHNHWWEYDASGKGDLLLSLCPAAEAQFDTYWMAVGGASPPAYLRRYRGRVRSIHVKDGPVDHESPMTALGQGRVDIAALVEAAREVGVEWSIVEIDRCATDIAQALTESAKFLRPLIR